MLLKHITAAEAKALVDQGVRDVRRFDDTAYRKLLGEAGFGFRLAHAELFCAGGAACRKTVCLGEGRMNDVRRNALGCHGRAELFDECRQRRVTQCAR